MAKNKIDIQLKETCQLTGAMWAVWLEHNTNWEILGSYKLTGQARSILIHYIQLVSVDKWLIDALSSGSIRSHTLPQSIGLPGTKLFIFPDQMTQRVILVGTTVLSSVAKRFWRIVALENVNRSLLEPMTLPVLSIPDLDIPYYLPEVLNRVLELSLQTAESDIGWLAIRVGDFLEIRAQNNCEIHAGERISIEANPLLREITNSRRGRLVEKKDDEWAMVPRISIKESVKTWAFLPLVIGQRLIGLMAFCRGLSIPPNEWNSLRQLAKRVSPSVEASIIFSDLTEHLGRMALLNDFAVTITSALDPEQITQRIFALLQRAFGTERINMLVWMQGGSIVQNYIHREGAIVMQTMAAENVTTSNLIGKSEIHRMDVITPDSGYLPVYKGSRSALVIPMKYRRQLIGILALESTKDGAFSIYDEHLLMVIASNLAGLLENGRLRREAEDRARNLRLIHEVIEQVIGITDLKEISQIAAELIARNFAYELAAIGLFEDPERDLKVLGIGGSAADLIQQGLPYMDEARKDGIVMRVAITGQNMLVNDVTQSSLYRPIPNWDAESEMCVALKDGDETIGVIDVESQRKNAFSQNDLIVLESLAGILSSVMSSARQYQKLQTTIDQLKVVREELQQRIIAQRMAESRLVQAAKLAAVGEMAAGIAHELNNPLTTVSGFTELVLEELPEGSGVRDDAELVLKEAQRARSVVRRLLDFARQGESARARSDINEIIQDVIALMNHLLHINGIKLITDLAEGLPWISVDRNQIKQVILNLIHNSLHAMPTGGELLIKTEVRCQDQRNWLVMSLRDTGIGIAPENLNRVFEPFFTTRSMNGGTGLGLSVTYGIITDHGGLIDVDSQVGKGSVFTVWLPIEEE